jgi:hypothetical protein
MTPDFPERLYAEKPKRFADRLAAYWEAWHPGDAG